MDAPDASRAERVPRPGAWVVRTGLVVVALQAVHRAWVGFPSWFLHDDYLFLLDARRSPLGPSYLFEPYSGHVVPFGRLFVWLAGNAGPTPWGLAASMSWVSQVLVSLACLWMLLTVLGRRPVVLVSLAVFCTTALTMPTYTWWVASLNTVPVALSFFLAVGCWVRYLRGRRPRWALLTGLAVVLGLSGDVLALLVLPVLAFLAVGWFASGGPVARTRAVLTRFGVGFGVLVLVGGAYTAYYLLAVPQITTASGLAALGTVAAQTVGSTVPAVLVGGPWAWDDALRPPTALVDPPGPLVSLAWVVIAMTVTYLALRRTRTLRAWFVLVGYLAVLVVLVASVRSGFEGATRELRFVNGVAFVLPLAIALACAPVPGAVESSQPRATPGVVRAPRWLGALLVLAVVVSGAVSSTRYAQIWHTQNASDPWVHQLAADLRSAGAVDVATTPVPDGVLNADLFPRNNSRTMVELLSDSARFPDATDQLHVVAADGRLTRALVEPVARSRPGPEAGCGWRVDATGATLDLDGQAIDYEWWLRVGYLSSGDSEVTVRAGDDSVTGFVSQGLGSLFVRVEAGFDQVRIEGLDPGTTLCVDTVEVGVPVAGSVL